MINHERVDLPHSAIERGKRLKRLRSMAGLTAEELANQIGVSRVTISYWENALQSGLSEKGAEKLIQVLETYGVQCSLSWLLLGIGDSPVVTLRQPSSTSLSKTVGQSKILEAEIQLFLRSYPHAVAIPIDHDRLAPLYRKGDWMGGCWRPMKTPLVAVEPCIVEGLHGLDVYYVHSTRKKGSFYLSSTPSLPKAKSSSQLKTVALKSIAPVLRLWRPPFQA